MRRAERWAVGLILIGHAFAHSLPGMRAIDNVPGWLTGEAGLGELGLVFLAVSALTIAMGSLTAAGMGALGAFPFRHWWRRLAVLGAAASLVLLFRFQPPLALPGSLLSLAIILIVPWLGDGYVPVALPTLARRWARRLGGVIAVTVVAYTVVATAARPWHTRWGTTNEELRSALPGDELVKAPIRYGIQHAITIDAPPRAVWPWLVQIGQDRGGFYSHDWLERLFGADIRNADRIVPEWQERAAGDSVFATQPNYLGLVERRLGWRVAGVEPGRALVLENWGAFVLVPERYNSTRLIVRTRGGGGDHESLVDLLTGPLGLLAFELPHFIMERGMLEGIKSRAEAGWSNPYPPVFYVSEAGDER
jgi:hypothetical protein